MALSDLSVENRSKVGSYGAWVGLPLKMSNFPCLVGTEKSLNLLASRVSVCQQIPPV